MKKQYLIFSAIACMMAIFNVKAQNTPIDDFLKKYPSREGVTSVTMSQQMLQSIFAPPDNSKSAMSTSDGKVVSAIAVSKQPASTSPSEETVEVTVTGTGVQRRQSTVTSTSDGKVVVVETPGQNTSTSGNARVFGFDVINQNLNAPEAYSSVTISKEDVPENLFTDFKKTLLSSKYEQFVEMNKENNSILGYYLKKANDKTNEIVVLRHQKNQFSAIYIKGDIDINNLERYLIAIKTKLNLLGANQTDMFPSGHQFAFAMPSFDNFNIPNFKFDSDSFNFKMNENFQLRLEESMEKIKDQMKNFEKYNRDFEDSRHNLQDSIKN